MKSYRRILVITSLLLLAIVVSVNAQRQGRGMMMDSVRMDRMMRQMPLLKDLPDSIPMRGFRHGMGMMPGMHGNMGYGMPGMQRGMRPGMGRMRPGMMERMSPGMRPIPMDLMRPGLGRLENIPNLTDKQKKEIADLRQSHQAEMKKLREEMFSKMKSLRDAQRSKIMGILTPEQKKWVEENTPKTPASQQPAEGKANVSK